MNQFPLEIVHHIFEYTGKIKYRNGKYMNQIDTDDNRYKMLQTIPLIQPDNSIWYMMLVSCKTNKIYSRKHIFKYGNWQLPILAENDIENAKEPILLETYSNTMEVKYNYYNQGFYYKIVIYKKQPPPFVESVLQKISTFIDDINTFIHL